MNPQSFRFSSLTDLMKNRCEFACLSLLSNVLLKVYLPPKKCQMIIEMIIVNEDLKAIWRLVSPKQKSIRQ